MKLWPWWIVLMLACLCTAAMAQVSYGAVAAYGLRKLVPAYTGNAIQVRRSCDNATLNIGFNSCGHLDTTTLKSFVLAANPLTALSTAPNAVYSLRKMRCAYAGPAIRVRSSAAATPTADIGFTATGDLDTAALKTFIGSNSGFVTIWYDQSGNNHHAVQATNAAQPRIVNAGVVDKQNSRPALNFDGADDYLQNNSYTLLLEGQTPTWNTVIVPVATNGAFAAVVSWRAAGGVVNQLEVGPSNNWNTSWWSNTNYNSTNGVSVANGSFQILTSLYTATANQLYVNGSLSYNNTGQTNPAVTAGNPGNSNTTPLLIGNDNCCGGRFIKGYLFEIVLASTNLSSTDRQFLEWSQGQYYSVSGPVLATLPAGAASGFVAAWYDQSGTSKHAVQATAANQPRIINAGAIEKNNTTPAIRFMASPYNLVAPLSASSYPVSISVLGNTSGGTANGAFFKLGTDVNAGEAGIAIGIGNSGGNFDAGGTSVIGLKEWVAWCPSNPNVNYPSNPFTSTTIQQAGAGGLTTFLNGTNVPLSNSGSAVGSTIAGNLFIGGYINSNIRYAAVKESEMIVFNSALSVTRRSLLETQQAAYTTITIATNKYTPPTSTSYNLYVNGVGRESSTDSVSGTRITTGMGIVIGQAGTDFLKDNGDYITFGTNCPFTASVTTANLPAGVMQRWFNDWYLNKTDVSNNNGRLMIFFDYSDYDQTITPGTAANYELLYRNSPSGTFSIVPGTTKSVSGDRVRFSLDAANLPTNYYYTIGTQNIASSPLPIELLDFEAACGQQQVKVVWSTASQKNNAHFSVERSTDGFNFETAGIVKGAGTRSTRDQYSFVDEDPLDGISYYRLRQTDFDGSEKVYKLSQVSCNSSGPVEMRIVPNPNKGTFMLEGARYYSDISVVNAVGKSVYERKEIAAGQPLDLSALPDGVYFITALDRLRPVRAKFIIQH